MIYPPSGVYFGFDFGTKYMGIAVGQTITQTATSFCTLKDPRSNHFWNTLASLIQEWQPKGFVIGLALQLDGSKSTTSQRAERFGQQLKEHFHLPIYFIEERLTTVAARERLKETYPDSYYLKDVDAMSAVIILESWFNRLYKETTTS